MGLFGRSNSKSNHKRNSNSSMMSGLKPVTPTPRSDNKGDITQTTNTEFDVGVASDCNSRYRKTMEDTSVVILNYMGIKGCAYFGIYDGHAGAQCATNVAEHLHIIVAQTLAAQPAEKDVPLALSMAFQQMDEQLKTMDIKHSGSTAVVAISCYMDNSHRIVPTAKDAQRKLFVANVGDSRAVLGSLPTFSREEPAHLGGTGNVQDGNAHGSAHNKSNDSLMEDTSSMKTVADSDQVGAVDAKRLSYDHRCNDVYEQRRVSNAGGIMINNRVNGMLAVTRSLGDLFMKDYVVGAPYTTETDLSPHDILVMACDGLWDVCSDDKSLQLASAVMKEGKSALAASEELLSHAISEFSVDNLTIMVVQFKT